MQFNWKPLTPILSAVENLQTRFDNSGLTTDDVAYLIESGLEIADLLDCSDAIASKRVH